MLYLYYVFLIFVKKTFLLLHQIFLSILLRHLYNIKKDIWNIKISGNFHKSNFFCALVWFLHLLQYHVFSSDNISSSRNLSIQSVNSTSLSILKWKLLYSFCFLCFSFRIFLLSFGILLFIPLLFKGELFSFGSDNNNSFTSNFFNILLFKEPVIIYSQVLLLSFIKSAKIIIWLYEIQEYQFVLLLKNFHKIFVSK